MRLVLDENLSPSHAVILRDQGHDAVAVVEVGLSGEPDEKIRNFANMLRFPTAGTPGVIRLKIHPPTEQAIRKQIQKALKLLKDTPLAGCLVVGHRDMFRIRS